MTIVRRLARPMLAAAVIQLGLEALRHPAPTVEATRPALGPLVSRISDSTGVPDDLELAVRVNGGLMTGAGLLFALGKAPRVSALVMSTTLLPSLYATGRFWKEKDPQARRAARKQALTDLGLVGGALLASVDTEGNPGVAWRTQHAGQEAKKSARRASKEAKRAAKRAAKDAARTARSAKKQTVG